MEKHEELIGKIKEKFAQLKDGMEALFHHTNEFRKKYAKLTPEQKEKLKAQYHKSVQKSKDLLRRLFDELHKLFVELKKHLHDMAIRVDNHMTNAMESHVAKKRGVRPSEMHSWASETHNKVLSAKEAMELEKWEDAKKHMSDAYRSLNHRRNGI